MTGHKSNRAFVFALGANKRTYISWNGMNRRCYMPTYSNFHHYGGRGIRVCERWNWDNPKAFENFFRDMGNPPDGMRLDRIDVNGNYEPENCRWLTKSEQLRGRRKIGAMTSFCADELADHVASLPDDEIIQIFSAALKRKRG